MMTREGQSAETQLLAYEAFLREALGGEPRDCIAVNTGSDAKFNRFVVPVARGEAASVVGKKLVLQDGRLVEVKSQDQGNLTVEDVKSLHSAPANEADIIALTASMDALCLANEALPAYYLPDSIVQE